MISSGYASINTTYTRVAFGCSSSCQAQLHRDLSLTPIRQCFLSRRASTATTTAVRSSSTFTLVEAAPTKWRVYCPCCGHVHQHSLSAPPESQRPPSQPPLISETKDQEPARISSRQMILTHERRHPMCQRQMSWQSARSESPTNRYRSPPNMQKSNGRCKHQTEQSHGREIRCPENLL